MIKAGIFICVKTRINTQVSRIHNVYRKGKTSKEFSLRKRCREYMRDTRDEITMMRKYLGRKLYFRYLPLDDDDIITKVERELLRVILPPCNSRYPDYNILPAKKAF